MTRHGLRGAGLARVAQPYYTDAPKKESQC
ncbi:hypothetical protein LMG26684_02445 [Achromobacter mucicolens]|nr:hypothetical protein LMG26684_02445 [Achromobacter mucicolens]